MRLKQEKVFVIVSTMLLMLAIPYIIPDISPIFTGPIEPDYKELKQGDIDLASDKFALVPHISYIGKDTDQFPIGENITYSAHAGIYVDGKNREWVEAISSGFVLDSGFYTSELYTPDEIERMNVGFLCNLIDIEGAILWTWGGDLKMKEASVFWDDNELYAKHYNTIDDGFSMTVYVLNNVPSGAGVIDEPDSDVDVGVTLLQVLLYSCCVFGAVAIYKGMTKRAKQRQALTFPLSQPKDLTIPELEPELTEEELEEIELERIRKESRLKTLEELIQNVTAIKSPQHVLDNTELSIEEFEPEDEREELAFGVLCNLQEEAKEKMRRDAIESDG